MKERAEYKKEKQWGTESGRTVLPVLFVCFFFGILLAGCGRQLVLPLGEKQEEEAWQMLELQDETEAEEYVFVHVCGAVNAPGLKKLPEGSRAFDALEMAQGFTEEADISAVNLAALVEDGQQLYFPKMQENREDGQDGKININTADEQTLCLLPGIGTGRAQAILKYRKEHGSFACTEELLQVPGIKEAVFEQICDSVTVK